MIELNLMATYS